MDSTPNFHRDRDGFWREVSREEHDRIMAEIAASTCPSAVRCPGDEVDARCVLRGAHGALRLHSHVYMQLHEDSTKTRRWWIDSAGDPHIQIKPGSPALVATEAAPDACPSCGYIAGVRPDHRYGCPEAPATEAVCDDEAERRAAIEAQESARSEAHYEIGNLRWATADEQRMNQRRSQEVLR